MKNIHANTAPGARYPAYISVNQMPDGTVEITTRSAPVDGTPGRTATRSLTREEARAMAQDILDATRRSGGPLVAKG